MARTLTSGQVSGMLGISIQTLQSYVKSYRQYFSLEAQKSVRGRRFNSDDIFLLLFIRRQKQKHTSDETILTMWEAEKKTFSNEQQEDIYSAFDILTTAFSVNEQAEITLSKIKSKDRNFIYRILAIEDRVMKLEKIEHDLRQLEWNVSTIRKQTSKI